MGGLFWWGLYVEVLWGRRTGCVKRGSRLKYGQGLLGWLKWPDSLAAADAQGSREVCASACVCVYCMFLQLQVGALVLMLVCMCMRVCIFACTPVHVRGRCEGFPSVWNEVLYSQRDATKRDGEKRDGVADLKRWKGRGRPQQNSFWSIVYFKNGFSPRHWQCDIIHALLFTERWTTTTSAASPFPASTTCPNYEPCKSHLSHRSALSGGVL